MGIAFLIVGLLLLVQRQAQLFAPEPVVVTDCFGGILAQDVVHCNVIQSAHNEGVMTVERMYTASGGRLLHIFITQDGSDLEGIFEQLKAKADAEIDALDDPRLCRIRAAGWCQPGTFPGFRGPTFMPQSEVYVDVRLHGGGANARRDEPGWASFIQVWPPDAEKRARSDNPQTFDVSDVDNSKPQIDCSDRWADHTRVCPELKRHPDLALTRWTTTSEKRYVEVKALPGQEGQAVAAAREELSARFSSARQDPSALVVIPVKYSYEELWHWQTILDRFARSGGNTIGIFEARLKDNRPAFDYGTRSAFPDPPGLEHLQPSDYDESRVRATIWLDTLDLEATLAALPQLLPQLGIPVDAVGVVYERNQEPFPGMELLPG